MFVYPRVLREIGHKMPIVATTEVQKKLGLIMDMAWIYDIYVNPTAVMRGNRGCPHTHKKYNFRLRS